MELGKVEQVREQVIALRPVYHQGGNATELILAGGKQLLDRRGLKSVVRALARAYAIDLKAQKETLREITQRKAVMPFYLGEERVFIPLKMRRSLSMNDATYGFVDTRCLDEIIDRGQSSLVTLSNRVKLEIFSGEGTVLQSKALGRKILDFYHKSQQLFYGEALIMEPKCSISICLGNIEHYLKRIEGKL